VTEERHEGHRDDARGDERASDHHRKAEDETADIAAHDQEGQVGDDVRDGGEEDGARQPGGPEPCGEASGLARIQLPFDGIACHHGVVDQEPERDDQRRDRHLLDVDAEQVHERVAERERERDGEREQERRAPLPEPDQADEYDDRDRLVEADEEQVDLLLDLARLIGGAGQDQVFRKRGPDAGELRVDVGAEVGDLAAGLHLHRHGDRAGALPGPGRVAPGMEVEVARWVFVTAAHVGEVAQVIGRAAPRCRHQQIGDLLFALQFAADVDDHPSSLRAGHAAGGLYVLGEDRLLQHLLRHAGGGESLLRVVEVDALVEHARARHPGDFRRDLDAFGDLIGEVVELSQAVSRAGDPLQLFARLLRLLEDRGLPKVGVQPAAVQPLALEAMHHGEPALAVEIAERVEGHEPVAAHGADVLGSFGARKPGELVDGARDGQRVQRAREIEDHGAAGSRACGGSRRAD